MAILRHALFLIFVLGSTAVFAAPDRPLVFIPGILGTRLMEARTGKLLWGSANALRNLDKLIIGDGPRDPSSPDVVLDGIVDDVSIFGVWKSGQYGQLRQQLKELGYRPGVDYFEFPYDWRQSNFTSASKLSSFIDTIPVLRNGDFDLLAHSMGGLVAEIYVRQFDNDHRVRRLIEMGVPFRGSVTTLAILTDGWGSVKNWLAGGIDTVRRFSLSMPSFYELLPQYENCCRWGAPGSSQNFSVLDPGKWNSIKWLADNKVMSQEKVDAALIAAGKLRQLVSEPYPAQIQPFVIAGSGIRTRWQFYVDPGPGVVQQYTEGDGDGTVPELSAVNLDAEHAMVSLTQHATIFDDDSVSVSLRRILTNIDVPRNRSAAEFSVLTDTNTVLPVRNIGFSADAGVISVGERVRVSAELFGRPNLALERVPLTLTITGPNGKSEAQFSHSSKVNTNLSSDVVFTAEIGPFPKPGIVRINLQVKGSAKTFDDFIAVVP
jgi:pimeloyl-ACP methyl ester carboxylesterase